MNSHEVIELYNDLQSKGIQIWIDGGWCVDALLGAQTREHPDLDIAVHRKDAQNLREYLELKGFIDLKKDDTTEWNFAMKNLDENIDIHVFEYDTEGKNIYGVEYPFGSLMGTGLIEGQEVNCISPEWMFKFKTAYSPSEKDYKDVESLAKKFGFKIPDSHIR